MTITSHTPASAVRAKLTHDYGFHPNDFTTRTCHGLNDADEWSTYVALTTSPIIRDRIARCLRASGYMIEPTGPHTIKIAH